MDIIIQQQIDELVAELRGSEASLSDPVAKLMVATLLHQVQKIKDEVERLPERVAERLCSTFVPKNKIDAVPAVCLVQPAVKVRKDAAPHTLADGAFFSFKVDTRLSLSYYPLFRSMLLPVAGKYLLSPSGLRTPQGFTPVRAGAKGMVWLGLEVPAEVETLRHASFLVRGTGGVPPRRIAVGRADAELAFATAGSLDSIPMAEPFDSQQATPDFMATLATWRRAVSGGDDASLVFITDPLRDRDVFRLRDYPRTFGQVLESADLEQFGNNVLWVLFDFGPDCELAADVDIIPNVLPVANVALNSVTLTQSSPIEKLNKTDGSFFFSVLETPLAAQHQGFSISKEEFVIRDFDTAVYNPANLYKDVRNLYNRFIDDYHAFVGYHALKDGESIRSLREMVNRIGKSVQGVPDVKNRFDEGTYAMRVISAGADTATSIKVQYLTTFGRLGNTPKAGAVMENKKDAALEKDVAVVTSATCGEDKADADRLYEMLRYYTLTADRLYTRMDSDALLRMQLPAEFGKEEIKRIAYDISVQGAPGPTGLQRGLYIDIRFKDEKNFRKATAMSLDRKLRHLIEDRSCLTMPVIVTLYTLENG